MKSSIIDIKKNGVYVLEKITGKIQKIFIDCGDNIPSNITLTFYTMESEIIFKTPIEISQMLLYPYNYITNQQRGMEFYSWGDLIVEVEGLQEGQIIDRISIFYI